MSGASGWSQCGEEVGRSGAREVGEGARRSAGHGGRKLAGGSGVRSRSAAGPMSGACSARRRFYGYLCELPAPRKEGTRKGLGAARTREGRGGGRTAATARRPASHGKLHLKHQDE